MKFFDKIKDYFLEQPAPHSAFQISSRYLSGMHVSPKERKIKGHFILPLERGVIQPSFIHKNIKNASLLEKYVKEGLEKLHLTDRKIACLIPELSLKAFVFSFESLPSSRNEREHIIRFRIKKQVPLLPDDARISFERINSSHSEKLLAAVAGASVIQEYEDFFHRFHLKVGLISIPTLCLYSMIARDKEEDLILLNVEEDFLSLVVIVNSEIALYRLKPFALDPHAELTLDQKVRNIIREVENTVNFIEDRERKKVNSLWIRLAVLESEDEMFDALQENLPLRIRSIEERSATQLEGKKKIILSPLIGQVL